MVPEALREAIEEESRQFLYSEIKEARADLTDRYRTTKNKSQHFITSEAHRCSYLITRMPATYAVIYRVLQEITLRLPEQKIEGLIDLGAGPGSVMWAACEQFPTIKQIYQVEQDPHLIAMGKRLARHSCHQAMLHADWRQANLETETELPFLPQDLVVLSYSIGELSQNGMKKTAERAWKLTNQFLVIIEPGTPAGFERIRALRSQLLALGAHMVAPCPHAERCPMEGQNWCHFSERLIRSSLHRQLKEGSLGHEDEKYSYLIFSKTPCSLPENRILRHPLQRSGHILMHLCTKTGVQDEIISKKTKERYRLAKELSWGDCYYP